MEIIPFKASESGNWKSMQIAIASFPLLWDVCQSGLVAHSDSFFYENFMNVLKTNYKKEKQYNNTVATVI